MRLFGFVRSVLGVGCGLARLTGLLCDCCVCWFGDG